MCRQTWEILFSVMVGWHLGKVVKGRHNRALSCLGIFVHFYSKQVCINYWTVQIEFSLCARLCTLEIQLLI